MSESNERAGLAMPASGKRRVCGELMSDKIRQAANVYGNRRKWRASKDPSGLPRNEKG